MVKLPDRGIGALEVNLAGFDGLLKAGRSWVFVLTVVLYRDDARCWLHYTTALLMRQVFMLKENI